MYAFIDMFFLCVLCFLAVCVCVCLSVVSMAIEVIFLAGYIRSYIHDCMHAFIDMLSVRVFSCFWCVMFSLLFVYVSVVVVVVFTQ